MPIPSTYYYQRRYLQSEQLREWIKDGRRQARELVVVEIAELILGWGTVVRKWGQLSVSCPTAPCSVSCGRKKRMTQRSVQRRCRHGIRKLVMACHIMQFYNSFDDVFMHTLPQQSAAYQNALASRKSRYARTYSLVSCVSESNIPGDKDDRLLL